MELPTRSKLIILVIIQHEHNTVGNLSVITLFVFQCLTMRYITRFVKQREPSQTLKI